MNRTKRWGVTALGVLLGAGWLAALRADAPARQLAQHASPYPAYQRFGPGFHPPHYALPAPVEGLDAPRLAPPPEETAPAAPPPNYGGAPMPGFGYGYGGYGGAMVAPGYGFGYGSGYGRGGFQRPYPYHMDYFKMKYGGSYAPYQSNLYGPSTIIAPPPYYGPPPLVTP